MNQWASPSWINPAQRGLEKNGPIAPNLAAAAPDSSALSQPQSPQSRFARGFVSAVAGFLALTGGVKLFSVLQETRVLAGPDPLLNGLTVRQVLFAAAVLELGVAVALWRHREARWVPWLVLWLVAIFGAYRLGLWAAGFEGHCRCLGHVFDSLPGTGYVMDRAMLGALVVIGLGSLYSFALSERKCSGAGVRKGAGKTSILLFLASLGSCGGFAAPLPPLAVTAQYRGESFRPGSADPFHTMELRISIYTSNRWWRIRTDPSLESGLVPVDWMPIPEGVRSCAIGAPDPAVTNRITAAFAYASTYPRMMDHTGVLLAWLAYVPRPELPVLDSRRIRRFHTPNEATHPRNEGTYGVEWLTPEKVFLARLSITNNGWLFMGDGSVRRQKGSLSGGWLEFEYRVSATANRLGVTVPTRASLTHYWVPPDGSSTELTPVLVETLRLVDVQPLEAVALPPIPSRMMAIDHRPPGLAKGHGLSYLVTNNVWKPLRDPALRFLMELEWRRQNKRQPSLLRAGFALLLIMLVLSPAALLFLRRSKRS